MHIGMQPQFVVAKLYMRGFRYKETLANVIASYDRWPSLHIGIGSVNLRWFVQLIAHCHHMNDGSHTTRRRKSEQRHQYEDQGCGLESGAGDSTAPSISK